MRSCWQNNNTAANSLRQINIIGYRKRQLDGEAVGAFWCLKGGALMFKREESCGQNEMIITIQGHEVMLQFAEEANPQIAFQVKQVLLGTYLMTGK